MVQWKEISEYLDDWMVMLQLLVDEVFCKIFWDIFCYWLSVDFGYMEEYVVRICDQYFEDFMWYEGEIFIDVGGYDGDIVQVFVDCYLDYWMIIFFEFLEMNMWVVWE